MQRAELIAELERLASEAALARARLAEAAARLKSLREQLGAADPQTDGFKLHSAG